jgi:hypothetical protein
VYLDKINRIYWIARIILNRKGAKNAKAFCSGVGPQQHFDIVDVTLKKCLILRLKTRFLTPKRGL